MATTVELRFRNVILHGVNTFHMHGFILVMDNQTNDVWISQWSPGGPCNCDDPFGGIIAYTEPYIPGMSGYGDEANQPLDGYFLTGIPAADIESELLAYSTSFSHQEWPYVSWGPNGNNYARGAWQLLTGSTPPAPAGSGRLGLARL